MRIELINTAVYKSKAEYICKVEVMQIFSIAYVEAFRTLLPNHAKVSIYISNIK